MSLQKQVPKPWQKFLGRDVLRLLPKEEDLGDYQPRTLFRALDVLRPEGVRVVLLGMDPYPGEGVPEGLAFSVPEGHPLPQSLRNIFKELRDDIGIEPSTSGSLLPWAKEGVLLWNVALSVQPGLAGSHLHLWQPFSVELLRSLADRPFILLGQDAQRVGALAGAQKTVRAPHPSPLSAWRGFYGSRIFSQTNEILRASSQKTLSWKLD